MRKRVLGKEYPDMLTIMANLAFTLKGHGQNVEAIKLLEKYIQLQILVLSADHLHTLSSSVVLIGQQTERLEINISAANMVNQIDQNDHNERYLSIISNSFLEVYKNLFWELLHFANYYWLELLPKDSYLTRERKNLEHTWGSQFCN